MRSATSTALNHVKRGPAAADGHWRQAPIECRQLSFIGDGKRQEIGVGDLGRCHYSDNINDIGVDQTEIVLPKYMARQGPEACADRSKPCVSRIVRDMDWIDQRD